MQGIVGTVGIVETLMVTAFPVPRFFFGTVGKTIGIVGGPPPWFLCFHGNPLGSHGSGYCTVGRKPLCFLTFHGSPDSHGSFPTLRNPPDDDFSTFAFRPSDFHVNANRPKEGRRPLESAR